MEFYEESQDEGFATAADYENVQPPKEKQLPILQTLSTLAGTPSKGPVLPDKLINDAYMKVAADSQQIEMGAARKLAIEGNVPTLESMANSLYSRAEEMNAERANRVKRIEEITRAAYENVVFDVPGVRLNNTPEKIAKSVEKKVSELTVGAVMESLTEKYGTLGRMGGAILQSFTPTALTENIALADEASKQATGEVSKLSYTDTIESLKQTFRSLGSEDERVSFIQTLHSNLTNTYSLTGAHALWIVNDVVSDEELGGFAGGLQTASPVLSAIPFIGQAVRGVKGIRAVNQLRKIDVATNLALAGAKDKLVSAAAQQVRNKALVDFTKEATGVQSLIDISNLTSTVLGKALPNAITLPVGRVQDEILKATENAIGRLRASVMAGNVRADEFDEFVTQVRRTYDPNIDKSIQLVNIGRMEDDALSVAGTVLRGTQDGTPYLTKEAAEEAAKLLDPTGKVLRPVQDTANNTYALTDATKKTYQLEIDAKQAMLLELQAQQGKVAPKVAPVVAKTIVPSVKLPKDLAGAKPNYAIGENKFSLQFDNDIDKAAFIVSQTKKSKRDADYVSWLKKNTGWDDAKIAEHGKKVRDAIKASAKVSEPGTLKVEKTVSKATQRQLTDLQQQEVFAKATGATVFELRGRMNTAAQSAAKRGDFKGVLSALEKSKNLLVAEVARRAKGLDTKIVISDDAVENYSAPAAWVRQDAIDIAKLHLNSLEEIRRIAPIIEALPDKKFSYGVLTEAGLHYDLKDTLKGYAKYGFTPIGDLPGGKTNLETKADFKAFKENFETVTREYGEDKLKITATASAEMVGVSGRYDVETDTIYIPGWLRHNEEVLAHEIVHAQVLKSIANPTAAQKPAVQRLENLYSHVKDKLSENKYKPYGIASIQEFIAEGLSNPMFQYQLNKISYKTASVWDSFVKAIANLIGIKSDSAFTELLSIYGELVPMKGEASITGQALKGAPENEIPSKIMETETKVSMPGMLRVQSQAGTRAFWETTMPMADNSAEIEKLQAGINLLEDRLKAAKDIEDGLSAGWLLEEKVQKSFDIARLGGFKEDDIQSMMRFAMGDRALGGSDEVYKNRLVGVMVESNIRQALINLVDKPVNKLSRKEKVDLNNILVKGDKEGKVFDTVELKGEGLSEKAQIAYYAVRKARDLSWQMRNIAASNSYTLRGWKDVWHPTLAKYKDEWGDFQLFGKIADEASSLNKTALDPNTGEVTRLTENTLEQLKNRGYVVVEFDEAVPMAGINRKRVVVPANGLKAERIQQVIPYRAGEFSRMYTDEYFIRLKGTRIVDDAEEPLNATHRTAASKREADMYVKAYKEASSLYAAGKLDEVAAAKMTGAYGWKYDELLDHLEDNKGASIDVNYTRTQDDHLRDVTIYQRSFTSKRGEHIKNVNGQTTNTADPLDALSAEISNTAYVASHTEWVDVSVKRWFETAKHILPDDLQKLSPEAAFAKYIQISHPTLAVGREEAFVRNVANQIAEGMKIQTKESKLFLGVMRTVTEGLDEKLNGNFQTVGSWMRQADFASFAKTASFHAVFSFNPVQFFVQGLNAYNAALVSPLHGLKSAKTYMLMRTALMSDNPEVWAKLAEVNKFTSLGLGETSDFIRMRQAIDRSGLISNLETSSLYGKDLGKYSITNGWFSSFFKAGTVPFQEGEEAARIISFDIARREWIDANPGKVWDSDEALREILVRQDALTGTMTNANAAWWQKGVVSVPAQFMQFPIKFGLNLINAIAPGGTQRKLTRQEALRMVFGNFIMFGAAGMLNKPLAQSIFGESLKEMSEEERLLLSQGVLSWSINAVAQEFAGEDVKVATGERFNPMSTYVNLASAILSPTDPGLWKVLGGAPGGTFLRGWQSMSQIKNLYYPEMSMTPEKLGETLRVMAQVPSVTRNYLSAERAGYLYDQMVVNGVAQYSMSDKERWFAQYLGIKPAVSVDYRMLKENEKEYNTRMRDEAKLITEYRINQLAALSSGDKQRADMFNNIINVRLNSLPIGDRSNVESQVKTLDVFPKYEEELRKYLLETENTSAKKTLIVNQKGQ